MSAEQIDADDDTQFTLRTSFGQKMLADTAKPVASGLSRGIDQAASS